MTMRVIRSPRRMLRLSLEWRRRGLSIGLQTTMGALHAGHLSLIRRARLDNDRLVVSIFVNPLQFGPKEDFARYPRPFARDRALCRAAGVDVLYAPGAKAMYPGGFSSRVSVEGLSNPWEGEFRPGFFVGVATVVLKLLEQVRPDRTYFGEKDFQQLCVVRRMARDLDLPVQVIGLPTVREPDGLALSSRNVYLSPAERAQAPLFYRALLRGRAAALGPGATPARIEAAMRREVLKIPRVRVDYLTVIDARTLQRAPRLRGELRLIGAIRIGRTRLIDNMPLICKD